MEWLKLKDFSNDVSPAAEERTRFSSCPGALSPAGRDLLPQGE